jgi:hypothetical protein
LLNPDAKSLKSDRVDGSDAGLYVLQHLDKLENYLKSMTSATGINALHYQDLLRRVKLIRERQTTVK